MGLTRMEALKLAIDTQLHADQSGRGHLAESLGVDLKTVGRWLNGDAQLTLERLWQIADVMDVKAQQLLDQADVIAGRAQRRAAAIQSVGDGSTVVAGDVDGDADAEDGSISISGATTVYGDVVVQAPKDDDDR